MRKKRELKDNMRARLRVKWKRKTDSGSGVVAPVSYRGQLLREALAKAGH